MKGSPIYATDIDKGIRNDSFFGKGFEEKVAEAEAKGTQVIVGYFEDKPFIDGE